MTIEEGRVPIGDDARVGHAGNNRRGAGFCLAGTLNYCELQHGTAVVLVVLYMTATHWWLEVFIVSMLCREPRVVYV